MKKSDAGLQLQLVPNPDILGELAQRRDLFKVGFAAETQDLVENATSKLTRKGLNMIVANDATASIGQAAIQVTLLDANGTVTPLERQPKQQAAAAVMAAIVERYLAFNQDR